MNDNATAVSLALPGPVVVSDWKNRVIMDSTLVKPVYFHPLAKYPGPKLAAMTNWVFNYNYLKGDIVQWQDEVHKKYGEVVRLGHDRLSYITASALKEIMSYQTSTRKSNPKCAEFNHPAPNGCDNIVTTRDDRYHGQLRRVLSNAFSEKALRKQQSLIQAYADKLTRLIRKYIAEDHEHRPAVDLVELFSFTTFDIMGDLTFGENMGNLDSGKNGSWVVAIMPAWRVLQLLGLFQSYVAIQTLFTTFMPRQMKEKLTKHWRESCESVTKRFTKGDSARPDLWGLILEKGDVITRRELDANSHIFMLAGTETTAASLAGQVYYLLKCPDKMEKLLQAVRSVADESELTDDRLRNIPYLRAVIEEGLRMYPPIPTMAQRKTPAGGNTLAGQFVPENTHVTPATWTAFRHPRWILDDPNYTQYHNYDKRDASLPFTYGTRACLGRNLAYYEMRIILARFLYNFDLELCPQSQDWIKQKSWTLWKKPPLMVKVSPRK
ncbi:cytochrome P450 [Xylariaceae sp. FL0662B]|nr:cytochrome P450 [Xylariaceae sp. FL0662B]